MSSRLLLISTGETLLKYLASNLKADVFLAHTESPEYLYGCLENARYVPDIVVLGFKVQAPIRMAEHILHIRRGIKIIIFCEGVQQEALQETISFSPFLNSDVIPLKYNEQFECLKRLRALTGNIEKSRTHKTSLENRREEQTALSSMPILFVNYLNKLLNKIPVGILNLDAAGRILNVNQCALSILQSTERELISTELQSLFRRKDAKHIEKMIRDAEDNEYDNGSLVVGLRKFANQRYLEISVLPQATAASTQILTVILQEVTEKVLEGERRKKAEKERGESERHMRLIIDAIPELIAYVDAGLSYQFNNKAYEKWYGLSPEQIRSRKIWEVIGAASYAIIKPYVDKVLSGQTVTFEEKVSLSYRGGGNVYIRSTYVPNYDDMGQVSGFFVLTTDITQSKNNEENEKKHMLELAHASRVIMVGEMSTLLAHELSQPLTSIEAYSRACVSLINKNQVDANRMLLTFENISEQVIRAQEIMHELRNFVRRDVTRKNVSVNELIKSAINLLKIELREYGLNIDLRLGRRLPLVQVDHILIEQVIINLIKNALEAMQEIDKLQRSLVLESAFSSKSDGVIVSVHDSGPGLSDYEFGKVFEPFYTTKPEGMGMGLAITRSIIDLHDGGLCVFPNQAGGTTFQFTLPVVH